MKDDYIIGFIKIIVILGVFALSMFLTKTIVEADIPLWLKIFLLK